MPRLGTSSLALAAGVALAAAAAAQQAPGGGGAAPADAPSVAARAPVYQLPKVGKPRGRIGGGRRGPIDGTVDVRALVPDHVGETVSAQPSVYWYLAEPVKGDVAFELTLIDASSIDPIVDRRIEKPASPGLQRVRLGDFGVALEPGQEYQWSIAVVPDPEDHSKDVVASGWIERVAPPEGMRERLAAAGPDGAAAVYGEAGLWYDMLDAACERVRAHPESRSHREQLAALLEQAGLPSEAALAR